MVNKKNFYFILHFCFLSMFITRLTYSKYISNVWFGFEFKGGYDNNILDKSYILSELYSISDAYSGLEFLFKSYLKLGNLPLSWFDYQFTTKKYMNDYYQDNNQHYFNYKLFHKLGDEIGDSQLNISYIIYDQPDWKIYSFNNFSIQPELKFYLSDYDTLKINYLYSYNNYPDYYLDLYSNNIGFEFTHELGIFTTIGLNTIYDYRIYPEKFLLISSTTFSSEQFKGYKYDIEPIFSYWFPKGQLDLSYCFTVYDINGNYYEDNELISDYYDYISHKIGFYPRYEFTKNYRIWAEFSCQWTKFTYKREDTKYIYGLNLFYPIIKFGMQELKLKCNLYFENNKSTKVYYNYENSNFAISLVSWF